MKKTFLFLAIIASTAFFTGCNKDDNNGSGSAQKHDWSYTINVLVEKKVGDKTYAVQRNYQIAVPNLSIEEVVDNSSMLMDNVEVYEKNGVTISYKTTVISTEKLELDKIENKDWWIVFNRQKDYFDDMQLEQTSITDSLNFTPAYNTTEYKAYYYGCSLNQLGNSIESDNFIERYSFSHMSEKN